MVWNWQQPDWPNFRYKSTELDKLEDEFLHKSGLLFGAYEHINNNNQNILLIDIISDEAINTSEIEGSYLNRDSVQSSLKQKLGIVSKDSKIIKARLQEQGIADIMIDVYKNYDNKLADNTLFTWHKMLALNNSYLEDIGKYRTHDEDMQVVSGPSYKQKIHFIAPPSKVIKSEMQGFIQWFNQAAETNSDLRALTRAAMTHLYFVCIHPFEDGNGRIARALSEKALYQSFGKPILLSISSVINNNKKQYYNMLNNSNKELEITQWLEYFAKVILEAQENTYQAIKFIITKTKFFDLYKDLLNNRQEKVISKMLVEGPKGFIGGLSAENYISITKISRATATRDLHDLVNKNILIKKGELKSTRYYLNLDNT